jgi:hypothetical protein
MFVTQHFFCEWIKILLLNQVFIYRNTLSLCIFWVRINIFLQMLKRLFNTLVF